MSVFAEKAAALQRKQAAEQKRAEEEKAAIDSKLLALEGEAAEFLQKLAELFDAERSGAPKLGFLARQTVVRETVPLAQAGLNLSFERNSHVNGHRSFVFRVVVNDSRRVVATLLQRSGESGPHTKMYADEDLGRFDHADIFSHVKAALGRALDRALLP